MLTNDLKEAMEDKDVLILAVPSPYTRSTAHSMKAYAKEGQKIVNVAKGIEENTLYTLSDIIEEELQGQTLRFSQGPATRRRWSRGLPTTCVVGAHTRTTAEYLQNIFMSPVFRVYTSPDMLGIELGEL